MGFSIAWISVKGQPREFVLEQMGLRTTGQFSEAFDAPVNGVKLPGGWYTVIGEGCDYVNRHTQAIRRISQVAEVVTAGLEEHVMSSYAEYWADGKQAWWLCHNASDGLNHLDTSGQLPAVFKSVREELEEKQRSHDPNDIAIDYIIDIPLELATRLTGFQHNRIQSELGAKPFETLVPIGLPKKKKWWQIWK